MRRTRNGPPLIFYPKASPLPPRELSVEDDFAVTENFGDYG